MDLYIRLLDDKTTFVDNHGECFSLKKRKNNVIKKFYIPIHSTTSIIEWVYENLNFKMIPRDQLEFANTLPLKMIATKTRNLMYQDFAKNSSFIVNTKKGLSKRSFDEVLIGDEIVVYDDSRKEITYEEVTDKMVISEDGTETISTLSAASGEQLELFGEANTTDDEGKISNYMIKSEYGVIINGILIIN